MRRDTRLAYPYVVWMVIFIAVPLLIVAYFAFTDKTGQFTLDNLRQIGEYAPVFLRSLLLAARATVICLVLAFPAAWWLSRLRANHQRIMLMLVMLPMWMNFLLRTYAWMTLLENNGLLNRLFGAMHLFDLVNGINAALNGLFGCSLPTGITYFPMINTSGAVVLGMVYNYLPYMILPLYTIMVKIDNSEIEAAQDLGANTRKIFTRVLIPMSMPGISTGITMVFVPSVSTFIISRMLGGGGNMLVGDLIELQFLGNSYNYNLGSAMSLVLMVIVLLCMGVTNTSGGEDGIEGGGMMGKRHGSALIRAYLVLLFSFFYLPIVVLMVYSFNESKSRSNFTGFTLKWYESLFHNDMILSALGLSLALALISAVIATVVGTMAAIGISGMGRKSRLIINNVSYIPVVNPEIITGVSLMLLFVAWSGAAAWWNQNAPAFLRFFPEDVIGFPSLLIAHISFCLPYVIFNVAPKLRQMDVRLYEAALDLGCNHRQAFFKVVLPELAPAIFSAFLISLTYSIDDFIISYFTCGTLQTLPIAIYSMTRKKVSPEINALSTIMFLVILAIILISNLADSRRARYKAAKKEEV